VNQPEPFRHVGTIKNYNRDKGFGFIDCPDVEKDIFVHQRQINGFKIGDRVFFKIDEDFKGMKAIELEYATDHNDQDHLAVRRSDSRRGWDQYENWEKDTAWAQRSHEDGTWNGRREMAEDVYEGVISYIDERGFGYIACPDLFAEDDGIFCDRRQIRGFNVDDRVQFHVRDTHGRLQAVGLSHAASSSSAAPQVGESIKDDILKRLFETVREPADGSSAMGSHEQAHAMNYDHANGMSHDQSNTTDGPLYQGVIKMFDETKGYGFILCPARGFDVYLPKVHLKGMKVGQSVNFMIREYKGKPQAYGLTACEEEVDGTALIMDSLTATQSSPSNQRRDPYHGVVKNFDQEKGYGFISCRELQEKYGVDTFVHQKGLTKGLTDLRPGDHVSFFIRLDDKSRPQAMKVSHCEPQSEGGEGDPFSVNVDKISYSGFIKSFVSSNDNEGYGFISCPEVFDKYNRDAFVHMKQIKEFKPGDAVTFSVRQNNLGHPQAYDLREAPKSVAWLSAADAPEEPAEKEEAPPDKEHFGKIKSFNEKQGYGFIHCEELHEQYGRDVFIPQSQFNGLNIGDRVSFHIQVKRGQPQAHDVVCVMTRTLSNHQSELQQLDGPTLDKKLLRMCASARIDSVNEIDQLLEAGANPNIRDVTGQTTVMIAALNVRHSERKCRLLIQAGAKIDIPASKAVDAHTVLQWARERINPSFAAFLEACTKGDAPDCEIELAKPPGDEF